MDIGMPNIYNISPKYTAKSELIETKIYDE